MPTDFPPPELDLPPLPDWLGGLAELDLPFPDSAPFEPPLPAGFDVATPAPRLAVTPAPVAQSPVVTPPPCGSLVPMAADAEVRRELPVRLVRGTDPGTTCWQLTVAPTAPGWDDVRVRLVIPVGLPAARITHKPTVKQREVMWTLGRLDAGITVPLQIRFPASQAGPALIDAPPPFELTYTPRPVARLDARATGPHLTRAGATVDLGVEVANGGTAAATNLRVTVMLGGRVVAERTLTEELAGGAVLPLRFAVVAPEAGPARWFVRCEADFAEAVTATVDVAVYAPFAVSVVAPDVLELDDEHEIAVRVENPPGAARTAVAVALRLPAELKPVQPDGTTDTAGGVCWRVAEWKPGEVRTFTARVRGHLPGAFEVAAEVTTAEDEVTVAVTGSCEMVRSQASRDLADWLREQAAADLDDQRSAAPAAAVGERHVVYRLGEQTFASPISQLREVVRLPAVTPVPGTPDWLLGVANIRGDVLSVVDFPAALGVTGGATGKRSVLVAGTSDGRLSLGLTVDEVMGIRRCSPSPWAADDRRESGPLGEFLTGLFEWDRRLTPVLDLDRVLTSDLLAAGDA